ncbi:MAG: hypothetical protein D3919_12050, partial [Candidatus Electrothrix sp. AW5]|nr:hypothetical protein [Candidatus Electrothrix gigas]
MFRFSSSIRPLGCSLFLALFFIVAGSGSSEACTPKIVWIADAGIPDSIPAGTSATFGWKVQNQSSCDAVDLRLGFYSANPSSSTADFGGDSNPSFSLAPWEKGIIEARMPKAPGEVGTYFEIKFDVLKSDGTPLDPLALGRLGAEFTITAPPAQPTTLISPSNNATIDSETPTLRWKSVDGATVYRVVLSENSSFSGLNDDGSGTTACINSSCQTVTSNSTSYQVGTDLTVEFNKTYYWKVRDDASGQWSDYFKFTVSEEEPPPPSDCTARFEFVQDGNQPDEV